MSLSDLPVTVEFKRRWPVGILLVLLIGGTWFAFDTRASDYEIKRRLDKIEAAEATRVQDEKQQREAASRFSERMARLETRIDIATDLLKEIRDGLARRPPRE